MWQQHNTSWASVAVVATQRDIIATIVGGRRTQHIQIHTLYPDFLVLKLWMAAQCCCCVVEVIVGENKRIKSDCETTKCDEWNLYLMVGYCVTQDLDWCRVPRKAKQSINNLRQKCQLWLPVSHIKMFFELDFIYPYPCRSNTPLQRVPLNDDDDWLWRRTFVTNTFKALHLGIFRTPQLCWRKWIQQSTRMVTRNKNRDKMKWNSQLLLLVQQLLLLSCGVKYFFPLNSQSA